MGIGNSELKRGLHQYYIHSY